MKQKFIMLLAAMLLSSASVFAQSGNSEPLKGDVNNDGKVDIADVVAVLKIMKDGGGTVETNYYWYVGQTDPSTMTEISPIVTDNTSPGWRLIGTELPNYSSSNMLWNGDSNNITFSNRDFYYIAIPNESIQMYNAANGSVMDGFDNPSIKEIGSINYYIYKSTVKARAFGYNIF